MNGGGYHESGGGSPQLPSLARRKLDVLVIEPDASCAALLARVLGPNASVRVVGSAHAAEAAMHARLPDLIVTELDLPGMSGLELIARVYASPATHDVLLLVTTARSSVHDKIAAFQAGADDYLIKPIESVEFLRHVAMLCRFQRVIGR